MGMGKVKHFQMTDSGFLRKLRAIVADTSRVIVTTHAKHRMRERRINMTQVLTCLRRGVISEPAHQTIHGDWKATLDHTCAGDRVRVSVALERQEDGEMAVVITVMD